MDESRKLKTNWPSIIFYIMMVAVFAGNMIINRNDEATRSLVFFVFFGIAALMCFIGWLQTRNSAYFNFMLLCVLMPLLFAEIFKNRYLQAALGILLFTVLIMHFYYLFARRIQSRHGKILELAAASVRDTRDGFTPRPFPAGRVDPDWQVLEGFTKFLKKNLIAAPLIKDPKVYLILETNELILFRRSKSGFQKLTYVSFDREGNVQVNIARKDYQKFKGELTFDQLCASLGKIFVYFLQLFQQGRSTDIIELIDRKSEPALQTII